MPPPDRTAYPEDLEKAEARIVAERRTAVGVDTFTEKAGDGSQLPKDAIGFGLSGGGIRSATFCLGLFQAVAEKGLLGKIDFLSTVSGGGYFGSFLGRLFTREWVTSVADAEHVLRSIDGPEVPEKQVGWASRTFRWLRDNGRYLAPRGSGDLIILGTILLRNWVAVQIVMVTSVLTVFVGLQLLRPSMDAALRLNREGSVIGTLLFCTLPGGNSVLMWSPWILLVVPLVILVVAPTGWAYWIVTQRQSDEAVGIPPLLGVIAALVVGLIGAVAFRQTTGVWLSVLLMLLAPITILWWRLGQASRAEKKTLSPIELGNLVRNTLTRWMKNGLLACGAVIAWTLIDTVGGTLYAVQSSGALARWGASVFTLLAGLGAFARSALVLLTPSGRRRPTVPLSMVSWAAAIVIVSLWLVTINVASHGVALGFKASDGKPAGFAAGVSPKILGADRIDVSPQGNQFVITAASTSLPPCTAPAVNRQIEWLSVALFGLLVGLTFLFGHTRTFANMSSLHAFYWSRLTRTFLGASNPNRLESDRTAVKDTAAGDDCGGKEYWNWPAVDGSVSSSPSGVPKPWTRGGPLHIINTTVNETMDMKSKVQNQDRKGTGLALGPCGLSLGIRHHLIRSSPEKVVIYPKTEYHVFRSTDEQGQTPDPLSLGRWMSVSGAAFSAAAGANTTVPIAILAGMFNVRLGYWWHSGTPPLAPAWKFRDKQWSTWVAFEAILPVQTALLAEMLARTRGTAGQLWNLSDGGHFENMGGYELIRRQLPLIVIVDAEADPDYTFQGLSDLVRKARLDFNAEITFLNGPQLTRQASTSGDNAQTAAKRQSVVPESVLPYFGELGALRRGRWVDESLPTPDGSSMTRYVLEVDRSRVSRAHAALAKVKYQNGHESWLVYIKATLMGDEPEDVCHYHRAHPEFPQETTNDQFFDEAQWESYRRLGLHVGHRVLTPELFTQLEQPPAS